MIVSPSLYVHSVLIAETDNRTMHIPVSLRIPRENKTVETKGLIDCAAGGRFIDQNFVRRNNLPTYRLPKPIRVYNVDGTLNKKGTIQSYVSLPVSIHGRTRNLRLYVCGLGRQTMILGMPWLRQNNPIIDWRMGTLEWRKLSFQDLHSGRPAKPPPRAVPEQTTIQVLLIKEDDLEPEPIWINAKMTTSQLLAAADYEKRNQKPLEELVPKQYHEYLHLFKMDILSLKRTPYKINTWIYKM